MDREVRDLLYSMDQKMNEMMYKIDALEKENKDLKLHIVSMHPAYSEEERNVAVEQILTNKQLEENSEKAASAFL